MLAVHPGVKIEGTKEPHPLIVGQTVGKGRALFFGIEETWAGVSARARRTTTSSGCKPSATWPSCRRWKRLKRIPVSIRSRA